MKVAKVNGATFAIRDSALGLGGSAAIPNLGELSDVDLSGLSDGDTITYDLGTDTWVPGTGSSGSSLPWYDVTVYGATGDGTTDDTTAIQDAIDACMAAGGGTVYFPPGIYQISGALQNTSTHNSQLVIPTAATEKAIRFLGFAPNRHYGGTPSTGNESVIRSDWAGTISGHPAIISAGTYRSIGASTLAVTFQDLTIIAEDDPKLSALQMTAALSIRILNVQIRTTSAVPSAVPTHTNAVGLDGPWNLGSQVPDYALGLDIYGFFTGIVAAEQFHGQDVGIAYCGNAVILEGASGTHYPVVFDKLVFTWCLYGLVFTVANRWVQITMMAVEHDTGIWAAVADVYDPSDYARGFIGYHAVAFAGTIEDLIFNGGAHLSLHWGHGQYWKLTNVVHVPQADTNPATDPDTGRFLYSDDTTEHLMARKPDGSDVDLESGGTPATTVTDETTFGISPAVGTDTEYARQDHTHGTPEAPTGGGIGPILIADVHSSPLIFADLIQTEAGDDLVYADPV